MGEVGTAVCVEQQVGEGGEPGAWVWALFDSFSRTHDDDGSWGTADNDFPDDYVWDAWYPPEG